MADLLEVSEKLPGMPESTQLGMAVDYQGIDPVLITRLFGCLALMKLAIAVEASEAGEDSVAVGKVYAALQDGLVALSEAAFRSSPIDETEFRSIWEAGAHEVSQELEGVRDKLRKLVPHARRGEKVVEGASKGGKQRAKYQAKAPALRASAPERTLWMVTYPPAT